MLLAVDGSEQSYEAAKALEHLAPAKELLLLHVMNIPQMAYPGTWVGLPEDLVKNTEQTMKEDGKRLLDRVVSMLPLGEGSPSRQLEMGVPADVILVEAEAAKSELIVVGSRGLSQMRELMLGSVSHRVMTHARCPVLVVKSRIQRLEHILLPMESPEDAEAAIAFLTKKPFRGSVKVTLLHVLPFVEPVWPVGAMIPESFRREMTESVEKVMNDLVSRLSSLGYKTATAVKAGIPSSVILEEASTTKADLILMGTHSRRGVNRFLLGSVSHSVVHQATCSVLLLK